MEILKYIFSPIKTVGDIISPWLVIIPAVLGGLWAKGWKARIIVVIVCVIFFLILVGLRVGFRISEEMVPPEISVAYDELDATVTIRSDERIFTKLLYSVDGSEMTPYQKPFHVYKNATVTARTAWKSLQSEEVRQEINMLPVYESVPTSDGKFILNIMPPHDPERLKAALNLTENGFLDFTRNPIAISGIGGAQFPNSANPPYYNPTERLSPDITNEMGNPPAEPSLAEDAVLPGGYDQILGDKSEGGYLTIRASLKENSVDIVLNKEDLYNKLEENQWIAIEAYYSEKTLNVGIRNDLGVDCPLDHGLLLELYTRGLPAGSYAIDSNGEIIRKSVARRLTTEMPMAAPEGQTPQRPDQPDSEQGRDPRPEEKGGKRALPHSIIVPVEDFTGKVALRIETELTDNENGSTYLDVPENYADAVAYASGHKLLVGPNPETFAPKEPVSYDVAATVLFRLENGSNSARSDVPWYEEGREWALNNGIVWPDESGKFPCDEDITQAQLLRMLWRYIYGKGSDQNLSDDEIQGWAVNSGIISQDSDNSEGIVSRAQLVRIIMNYCIADADWKKANIP